MAKGDLISRSELLKEFDPNGDRLDTIFVRSRIVQARSISDAEIIEKVIDEFSERLKKHLNQFDFWKYGITDGTNCEMRNYDYMIDEIAEALLSQKILDKSVVRRIAEQLKQ